MEQIFKTIDRHPTMANIGLWIMAGLMAWVAFNYEFTTTL